MSEGLRELWNSASDSLQILWNMIFGLSDRQIEGLLVIGTFAVAIVAAFQDRIRSCLFAPRLKLEEHRDYPPDAYPVPILDLEGNIICNGCFVGLPIKNDGPASAKDVEVVIGRLERYPDSTKSNREFYPLSLSWRHYHPPKVFLRRISPGCVRYIGLGYIPLPSAGKSKGELQFEICSAIKPTTRSDILQPGTYRLTLEISAANSRKPVRSVIELSFTGKLEDNMKDMVSVGSVDRS